MTPDALVQRIAAINAALREASDRLHEVGGQKYTEAICEAALDDLEAIRAALAAQGEAVALPKDGGIIPSNHIYFGPALGEAAPIAPSGEAVALPEWWRQEVADVDRLLEMFGVSVEQARTEGGRLRPLHAYERITEVVREAKEALEILKREAGVADGLAGAVTGSCQCPLCGWTRPHEHSPLEITIYNNGRKAAHPAPSPAEPASSAAADVLAERRRQIEREGWTPEHDDEHDGGDLACAGAAYALNAGCVLNPHSQQPLDEAPEFWPWREDDYENGVYVVRPTWWKPKDPRCDLVRAAALIIAEIERLDRATLPAAPGEKK